MFLFLTERLFSSRASVGLPLPGTAILWYFLRNVTGGNLMFRFLTERLFSSRASVRLPGIAILLVLSEERDWWEFEKFVESFIKRKLLLFICHCTCCVLRFLLNSQSVLADWSALFWFRASPPSVRKDLFPEILSHGLSVEMLIGRNGRNANPLPEKSREDSRAHFLRNVTESINPLNWASSTPLGSADLCFVSGQYVDNSFDSGFPGDDLSECSSC
jgi:hypothetical protein